MREVTGRAPTTEGRSYLRSLRPDIGRFARAVRGHWSVENQLHWSLDVSFEEDRSRARTRHAATNLATLRRITLSLLRADQSSTKSLNRKRLRCALVPDYLISLLNFSCVSPALGEVCSCTFPNGITKPGAATSGAIKKIALALETHLQCLLSYFQHRITNAGTEACNDTTQTLDAAARGFRNFDHYRTRFLCFLGRLNLHPP